MTFIQLLSCQIGSASPDAGLTAPLRPWPSAEQLSFSSPNTLTMATGGVSNPLLSPSNSIRQSPSKVGRNRGSGELVEFCEDSQQGSKQYVRQVSTEIWRCQWGASCGHRGMGHVLDAACTPSGGPVSYSSNSTGW